MKKSNLQVQACFQLLQKVLLEAFQTDTLLFSPPYGDFTPIDQGIRSMIWQDFFQPDIHFFSDNRRENRRLFVIRSNLGFYNIIACLNLEEKPDFISVGPFRAEEFSADYFLQLVKDRKLSAQAASALKYFYEGFPYVQLSSVVEVTKQILAVYFPEFEHMDPVTMEFLEQEHTVQINAEMLQEYTADFAELYQSSLAELLIQIKSGRSNAAQQALNKFLKETKLISSRNIGECKKDLSTLNDYCHMALLGTNVHPAHVLKLYAGFRLKISGLTSHDMLKRTANDICRKYCLLVKNYAFSEYSKTVSGVINYIYLHLDEKLTLSLLAEHFNKNAASLSNSFSKETGMSVTEFIHKVRIDEAIRYFNTTKLSVSEVAAAVGFHDFSYFSRLFRRQTGYSPREYCRRIR